MKTDAQIRKYVMRRVYFMYCTRAVCKPVPRTAIFAILFLALVGSVSIVNVFTNALSTEGVSGFMNFLVTAFIDTNVVVQTVSVALFAWIAWFAFDTAQNIETVVTNKEMV